MLECSMAIKCPSVDFQLTTFKKYQQAFSNESLLQEVTQRNCERIKSLFKGIWSLEDFQTDQEVKEIMLKAIEKPHDYVLKP